MNIRGNISLFQPFRTALLSAFGDLNSLSMSTLNSFLKSNWIWTLKRAIDLSQKWQRMLKFVVCANELPYFRHLTRQRLSLFTLMSSTYLPDILVADHEVNREEKGFIKLPNDIFTWSIAISFSKQSIYGWMATREVFTADKMKDFYYELFYSKIKIFKEDNELPVFVW